MSSQQSRVNTQTASSVQNQQLMSTNTNVGVVGATSTSSNVAVVESAQVQPQWQSQTSTLTTTSTLLPPMVQPNPTLVSADVTKTYMPTHSSTNVQVLLQKLEQVGLEIDAYAKAQQDMVSQEAMNLINECIVKSKQTQDILTQDVHARTQALDGKYQVRREELLKKLDVEKAAEFTLLQEQFVSRQNEIQEHVKKQVDDITEQAKLKKLAIVGDAQQKHASIGTTVTSSIVDVSSKTHEQLLTSNKMDVSSTGSEPRANARVL